MRKENQLMSDHLLLKMKMLALVLFCAGLSLLAGCRGETGPAGLSGTPGTFRSASCTDCHHLNNTTITPSAETFIDGLAGPDRTISAGTSTTLAAVVSKLPAGETASSFLWTQTAGLATTLSGTLASSATVTLLAQPTGSYDYKQALVNQVPSAALISDESGSVIRDATMVVPITNDALELASAAQFKLTVFTTSGKAFFDLINVFDRTAQAYLSGVAAVNTGLQTQPVNVPVLVKAKTGLTGWTVDGPSGALTVTDSDRQIANFTPTSAGTYTVSVGGAPAFTIFAGTWRGAITGVDGNDDPIPDTVCTACHNDTIAPDTFTPWKKTGHAHIFSKNLNAGGHYGPGCFQCHTVGFNTNAANNGFDDQPNYSEFIADKGFFSTTPDASRYKRMWSSATYSALAKETNVQCEHCHGPQNGAIGNGFVASHTTTTDPSVGGPRLSLAADVCGFCHGEPLRHSRFQQWQQSGHGQFDLAIEEAVSSTTDTGSVLSTSCAGCHSAQGALIYFDRLQSGIPLRTLPAFTIPPDSVQPVTCAVCHDPHDEGTTSGKPNTATVRISDNTPKLPGGFMAIGVGRGAMCIVCHNSRNGTPSSTNEPSKNIAPFKSDSFLHQDGDPVFGNLTGYAAPHIANQGDVLMGKNAYFVGNGNLRSPHSLIVDTCANCHMEKTPPPPLLSYNLSGTNHTFRASTEICATCHGVNEGLAPMLQKTVRAELDLLQESIVNVIISRTTGTPIVSATLTTFHGNPAVNALFEGDTTPTVVPVANIQGMCITGTGCLGTDVLAKALWNYFLILQDTSMGIHNPDFTFLVLGETKFQANSIHEP